MAFVKVWNKNDHDYEETFKGNKYKIKAGSYVEMERDDAIQFLGTMQPPKYDASGNLLPTHYKKLWIEGRHGPAVQEEKKKEPEAFICNVCGQKFTNQKDLDNHVDKFHLDLMADQELAEKRKENIKKSGKDIKI